MDIKQYNGKIVALVKPCISIDEDVGGIFKSFHQTNRLMCGLFYVKTEKDQFTDTIHVYLKPMYRYQNYFNEFTKDFTYNGDDLLIIENTRQRFFNQCEINKAHGFADFINRLLDYKYKVESNPFKFYINYDKHKKYYYQNNNWYISVHKEIPINEKMLISNFFDIPWEYDYELLSLKKYNIFKRFFSIFNKTNNLINI